MLPPEDPERVTFGGSMDQRDNLGLRCMRTNRGKELWSEVQYEEDTRPNGVTLTGKPVWHPSPVREYVHDEGTVSQVKECTLHNITHNTQHTTHTPPSPGVQPLMLLQRPTVTTHTHTPWRPGEPSSTVTQSDAAKGHRDPESEKKT